MLVRYEEVAAALHDHQRFGSKVVDSEPFSAATGDRRHRPRRAALHPLHVAPGSARPHPAAVVGQQGVHSPGGRATAGKSPRDRVRAAGRRRASGRNGLGRGLRLPVAGHGDLRAPRGADKATARSSKSGFVSCSTASASAPTIRRPRTRRIPPPWPSGRTSRISQNQRRKEPRPDLISGLVAAEAEGDRLCLIPHGET